MKTSISKRSSIGRLAWAALVLLLIGSYGSAPLPAAGPFRFAEVSRFAAAVGR
jgi:hypothetical protein